MSATTFCGSSSASFALGKAILATKGHDDFHVMRIILQGEPDGTEVDLIESYRAEEAEAEALIADPDIRREIETLASSWTFRI